MAERLTDPLVRLLTLTGPGGIGKTRLAIRVARDVEDRFASGAAFVDLSDARDTTTMITTIARDLGYSDVGDGSELDELVSRIGGQQVLTVLDNFEQVTVGASALAQLLRDCPELKLLVTSREALHVRGEHIFPVDPMRVPAAGGTVATASQVEPFEAVQLFVERARAVDPGFRVTDDNAAVVAEICRRLEGLPLAIELATARLRVFSLETLRDRLGNRLRGLGSGARDLPERQQTLRATIDWSYQLLNADEQRLFELFGAFWGAELVAVELVAAAAATLSREADPVDALASLVDKSLVRRTERGEGEPRLEMLESIREFAAERLDARADDATRVRTAHAEHFAAWAAARRGDDPRADRTAAIAALGLELENLRAAWRWSLEAGDLARLEQLHRGLRAVYDARGWYRAIHDLAGDVLGVLETVERTPEREVLAIAMASDQARALTALEGYTAEVETAYERLLASVGGSDVPQVYPILRGLAGLYSFRGEDDRANELARRILRLADDSDDPAMRVDGHLLLGMGVAFGRIEEGMPILEAGLAAAGGDRHTAMPLRLGPDPLVATHTALSLLNLWVGRNETSMRHSQDSVAVAERLGHPSSLGYALFHASLLRLWRREPDAARELAVRTVEFADEHSLRIWTAVGTVILGAAAVDLGLHDDGLRWVDEGLDRYRGLRTPPIFWPFLLQIRASAAGRAGQLQSGLASISEALAVSAHDPNLRIVHGDLLVGAGRPSEALVEFDLATEAASAWGAAMSALRAVVRAFEVEPTDARRDRVRTVLSGFREALDLPELVAARAIADGDDASGA
jgi:predicted ATPase